MQTNMQVGKDSYHIDFQYDVILADENTATEFYNGVKKNMTTLFSGSGYV